MVSESQKRTNRKWDAEHMKSLSCRLRKEDAQDFIDYCTDRGTTPGRLFKEVALKCVEEYRKGK